MNEGIARRWLNLDELFGAGTLDAYHASEFGATMLALAQRYAIHAITSFSDLPSTIAQFCLCFAHLIQQIRADLKTTNL